MCQEKIKCTICKRLMPLSHFDKVVTKTGKIWHLCKENSRRVNKKPKKRKCTSCGNKYFPVDHFTDFFLKSGKKILACKINLEKNGGKLYKSTTKRKRKRTKYLNHSFRSYGYNRSSLLYRHYGLLEEDYEKMLDSQNHCCAICGLHKSYFKKPLHVDHCHETGIIRGLLCGNCNSGIGNLMEDITILNSVILYLENSVKFPLNINQSKITNTRDFKIDKNNYKKESMLIHRYGITLEDYNKLLIEQNNCCKICNKNKKDINKSLVVDHNHSDGKIRGLLCESCNHGVGKLKDNTIIITNAIKYLEKYGV